MPTVISTYARGEAADATLAQLVFNEMAPTYHDLGSWNVVVSTHTQNGLVMDALKLYHRMCGPDNGGVKPDAVTLVDMFSYAQLGTCNVGRAVCSGENKWNGKLRQ
jgi:pentatricopeptide repeat protein